MCIRDRLYAAHWQGPWQAQAQWVSGHYQQQLQRHLVLGELQETVGSQRSGHYQAAYAELGRQFQWAGLRVTPYVGSQLLRVANAGFDEGGSTGFGLRANAWDASRWQGMVGLRASQQWRLGDAVPVSYTHLDVYKRQVGHRVCARISMKLLSAPDGPGRVAGRPRLSGWSHLTPSASSDLWRSARTSPAQCSEIFSVVFRCIQQSHR